RAIFFFQAEDGIRDRNVTGVQTCALPICIARQTGEEAPESPFGAGALELDHHVAGAHALDVARAARILHHSKERDLERTAREARSEERRVGKECRCREWP